MRILLLGAYGFIGSEVARGLLEAGHEVVGFGRSAPLGRRLLPEIRWVEGDLNRLTRSSDWHVHLEAVDAVVNASGALQSGGGDRLEQSQAASIVALIAACEASGVRQFVQISAPGVSKAASTEFMRTKAVADERLAQSLLHWTILRPGLVIGRNAYGGTLLIRMLASFPIILPVMHARARVSTVAMSDVVDGVRKALGGRTGDFALVAPEPETLRTLLIRHREWLGFGVARGVLELPAWLARPVGSLADLLGWLGWRSPLRSTAMKVIAEGVSGSPRETEALLGRPAFSLDQTLKRMPSGIQDRWHAGLNLLLPVLILALSLLWLGSGLVGLWRMDAAVAELGGTTLAGQEAKWLVVLGSAIDLLLGLGILLRRAARGAAMGMVMVSASYLLAGTLVRPDLWLDPLGPLLKVLPAMALALAAHAMLERR